VISLCSHIACAVLMLPMLPILVGLSAAASFADTAFLHKT